MFTRPFFMPTGWSITPPHQPDLPAENSRVAMCQLALLPKMLLLVQAGRKVPPKTPEYWLPGIPFLQWPPPTEVLPPWKRQRQTAVDRKQQVAADKPPKAESPEVVRWRGEASAEFSLIGNELRVLCHSYDGIKPLCSGKKNPGKYSSCGIFQYCWPSTLLFSSNKTSITVFIFRVWKHILEAHDFKEVEELQRLQTFSVAYNIFSCHM